MYKAQFYKRHSRASFLLCFFLCKKLLHELLHMEVKNIAVDKLIPYEFNNKKHDVTQIDRIANSIKEFGFTQPIVIDKDNFVIIGHGRLEASKKLGLDKVPCVQMDKLNATQIKKLRILDNKLNESERDMDNLRLELGGGGLRQF